MIHTLIDIISWIAIAWLICTMLGCFATVSYLLVNSIKDWLNSK